MMIEIRQTVVFTEWLKKLNDSNARARILLRLKRVSLGNLGDVSPIDGGVSELRIHYGPGYRIYFTTKGDTIVILLCGGDKSTQAKDIAKAKKMAKEI